MLEQNGHKIESECVFEKGQLWLKQEVSLSRSYAMLICQIAMAHARGPGLLGAGVESSGPGGVGWGGLHKPSDEMRVKRTRNIKILMNQLDD